MSDKHQLSKSPSRKAFGEVISSDVYGFSAQCWKYDQTPEFASIVKVHSSQGEVFGCVTGLKTGSSQPGRQPFAYGLTPEELEREQPQIFNLLASWIDVRTFAHSQKIESGKIVFGLAPKPCQIHAHVQEVDDGEFLRLSGQPMFFFKLLVAVGQVAEPDQIALSLVLRLSKLKSLDAEFFENFYEQYSRLPDVDSRRARILFMSFSGLEKR